MSNIIERIYGDEELMEFTLDIRNKGKILSDVTEIYFSVKEKYTDIDTSLVYKTRTALDITTSEILPGLFNVYVSWKANDYNLLILNKLYYAGLFVKFTGQTLANENVDKIYQLKIVPDYLRS